MFSLKSPGYLLEATGEQIRGSGGALQGPSLRGPRISSRALEELEEPAKWARRARRAS